MQHPGGIPQALAVEWNGPDIRSERGWHEKPGQTPGRFRARRAKRGAGRGSAICRVAIATATANAWNGSQRQQSR